MQITIYEYTVHVYENIFNINLCIQMTCGVNRQKMTKV